MPTPLEELSDPLVFRVDDRGDHGLDAPSTEHDRALRTRLRSLEWMQKEALVTDSASGETWRLPTDEGPYLDAADVAPPPLGFTTAGLIGSYTSEIRAVARRRGVAIDDLEVGLECFYTAAGSVLAGTRSAVVLPPELDVSVDADADEETVLDLVETAAVTAPVNGGLGVEHTNRFALSLNGQEISPGDLAPIEGSTHSDPAGAFEGAHREAVPRDRPIIRHTGERTEELPNAEERWAEKVGVDSPDELGHVIHLEGTCRHGDDGLYEIEQKTYSPRATTFEFLAEEPPERGGRGRAPDPLFYFAAAPAFCLTTHVGVLAEQRDVEVDYRIVQDTHFSTGPSADEPATAEALDTHVFLDAPADEGFARELLELSEQACYVHELWRSPVSPEIAVTMG